MSAPKEIASITIVLLDDGRLAVGLKTSTPLQGYMMLEGAKEQVLRESLRDRPVSGKSSILTIDR